MLGTLMFAGLVEALGEVVNVADHGPGKRLVVDAGVVVLTAFISPFRKDRDYARGLLKSEEFIEVFVDCSLEECEKRDPKGMYKKAREGIIKKFIESKKSSNNYFGM